MRKIQLFPVIAALFVATPSLLFAAGNIGIEGSPHDFAYAQWNTRSSVCSPCHQAHNTAASQIVPLWSHATSVATFTPYASPTFNAGSHLPSGSSLGCLSCHDGTVAINQYGGQLQGEEPEYIDFGDMVSADLHTVHPISFTYDASLAAADSGLENPTLYRIGDAKGDITVNIAPVPAVWSGTSLTGKTIDEALLLNHKVECASCHDVHKQAGSAPTTSTLLRIFGSDGTGRRDLLCRTCHIK